jgi:hypothetical protein
VTRFRSALRNRLEQLSGDRGSTLPLILGFWLIGMLIVGGAVALSDAFTKQRDLQSICDGAAIAAANSASQTGLHGDGTAGSLAIPLANAGDAVAAYLARDAGRSGVHASGVIDPDGVTVHLTCTQRTHLAFGGLISKSAGVDQTADTSARSPVTP